MIYVAGIGAMLAWGLRLWLTGLELVAVLFTLAMPLAAVWDMRGLGQGTVVGYGLALVYVAPWTIGIAAFAAALEDTPRSSVVLDLAPTLWLGMAALTGVVLLVGLIDSIARKPRR